MTPVNPCPNQATIDKLAHEMWYVEDSVTIRLAKAEDRMVRVEKDQGKINSKLNWLITLLVGTLVSVIVELVKR